MFKKSETFGLKKASRLYKSLDILLRRAIGYGQDFNSRYDT